MSASRSASRALLDLSGPRSSSYVCRSCRRSLQRSFSTQPRLNQEIPFTEKIRRKIWGTDNPPGLKDPYGGPSFLERRRMERQARERAEQSERQAPSQHKIATATPVNAPVRSAPVREVSDDYTPAETWDGLDHVGHVGEWQDMEEVPSEQIEHFLSPPPNQQPPSLEDLTYAMSRAIVECSILPAHLETTALDLPTTPDNYSRTLAETPILLDANNQIQGINIPEDARAKLAETLLEPSTTDALADPEKHIPSNPSWLDARLDFKNPLTFQILSRFSLLTHTRIPDPVLTTHLNSPSSTIQSLLRAIHSRLVKKAPFKLAEKLRKSEQLAGVSNLVVFPRRESQIDKEKELGRWKVIERELRERGLPLVQGGIKVQK